MARGGEKPFLHFDIIINILGRLPVKSILRFRSVCKDWNNLFKTQSFIAKHARHSAHESPFLLLHAYDYSSKRPSLRLLNQKMETIEVLSIPSNYLFNLGWRIIGSCNGLLCVEGRAFRAEGGPFRLLRLWNPLTREVREIPPIRNVRPSISGFGFSSIVNDYKIVTFSYLQTEGLNYESLNYDVRVVHVYSLSTDSWKELEFGALQKKEIIEGNVSVDGTMAWIGYDDSFHVLVTFDIVTEVFTSTPIPSAVGVLSTDLGVYQNKFLISGHHGSHFMDIWVMEQVACESGKHFSCSEKYSVDLPSYALDIFCIWGNEIVCCEEETKAGVEGKSKFHLKLFNLTTRQWKEFPNISSSHDCCVGFSYGGSLVSLFNPQVQ
ncbi:hypothetical protein QN277_005694 [Acacia crassicarpa]|uniref:F-box domain-containing protein n=1 Tax=Acacia crassicarpa TaxID=499986 RepID=A0AAE1IYR5_9FABA|nr:hypothetical protein QN277_005694 [Acacia crassicarpa]